MMASTPNINNRKGRFVSSSYVIDNPSAGIKVDDAEIQLLVPSQDVADPELSIVIPALNEELTIGQFVDWCMQGLQRAGVKGEVLIIDSSTDSTADIALAKGARVLKTPKRGLGRAYIDAIPFIRGQYVLMGDADCTYDFRELEPFMEKFRQGYEYVMGSRFKGSIEKKAMPPHHRYFGTPLTTWMLNVLYGSRFSDIHCGMRGITKDALKRMRLESQSWQYASEMIIKSIHMGLRTTEVPVLFYKDMEGRESHLKRGGWWMPWFAGWITLEIMLTWGADFFLLRPGILMFFVGGLGVAALFNGPVQVGNIGFSLHWMLLFLLVFIVGIQWFMMGNLARVLYGCENGRRKWQWSFRFGPAVLVSSVLALAGLLSLLPLAREYVADNYRLPSTMSEASFHAVAGIGLILWSFIHFTFSMVYNAAVLVMKRPGSGPVKQSAKQQDS